MLKLELVTNNDVSCDGEFYIFKCPYDDCDGQIIINKNEINCKIFRHAILKKTMAQISQHATKNECDSYLQNEEVYGCARPFCLVIDQETNKIKVEICDYI